MHDNNLYKILRIVFLTLAIISLVFTLAKKVGLCADSSSFDRSQICGTCYSGISPFSDSDIASFISFMDNTSFGNKRDDYFIYISSIDSDFYYLTFVFFDSSTNYYLYSNTSDSSDSSICFADYINGETVNLYGYKRALIFKVDKTDFTDISYLSSNLGGSYVYNFYLTSETYESGLAVTTYPFYTTSDFLIADNSNDLNYYPLFKVGGYLPSSSGLVDFNELQNIVDSTIDISSDMSDFIEDLPTDNGTTAVGQWLSNIFRVIAGGFQGLFYNIFHFFQPYLQGILDFFQSIYDTIVDFASDVADSFSTVVTTITSFFNSVKRVFDWFYEHGEDSDHQFDFMILFHYLFDFDTEAALDAFEENKYGDFILDVRDFCSTVYNSITGATASERVFFTISLGDHFGTHFQDIIINFDWYANVRDTFLPYLMAFIYVSAIWLFIKRLPDIIHGAASAESSFVDALPEHAEVSHGLFTHGVSHNQPSLDKSPLSGGGGVHSGSSQFWY